MAYSDITFNDPNPIKRWLQIKRLITALHSIGELTTESPVICDFGAGNGELCKYISESHPRAQIVCYEPNPLLLQEAKQNLSSTQNITFVDDLDLIHYGSIDIIFSLEVFEHLPSIETSEALSSIYRLLKGDGKLIIGVPVEIGIPALYKGIFRMLRRFGEFDATPKNILLSVLRNPPRNRPISEISPGLNYHFHHMGFDFRDLLVSLSPKFLMTSTRTSPFAYMGTWIMPEVNLILIKR